MSPAILEYFECNFDNRNEALCGMSQATSDDFDWDRHAGETGSSGTGPSADHTKVNLVVLIKHFTTKKIKKAKRLFRPKTNSRT